VGFGLVGFGLLFGFGLLEYPIDVGVEYPEKGVPVVNVQMEGCLTIFWIFDLTAINFRTHGFLQKCNS
jgi:hypothetical protein